jgi:hypothetical protein
MDSLRETLEIQFDRCGKHSVVVTARMGDESIAVDKLDLVKESERAKFAKRIAESCPGIDVGSIEEELLKIAGSITETQPLHVGVEAAELNVSQIVRPDLFHIEEVSGILIPTAVATGDRPAGRWQNYLQWRDGTRERRDLQESIEIPDGRRIWLYPTPADPLPTLQPGWSIDGRRAWLDGVDAPSASSVFKELCTLIARFLDFDPSSAAQETTTLALWSMLTYCYTPWSSIPYLHIVGPLGSGKTRVFEVLARIVYRPLQSSNLTAASLFRTLHETGGTLLLDEADRLGDRTPETRELESILLSGYKAGSPAVRLERSGDGFVTKRFNVFGPKAIAGIANLSPALASRCIRFTMFRCDPESPKPRRRIDENLDAWASIRDDMHHLALEYGSTWRQLSQQDEVCPVMSARNYELWQPILSLAAWIENSGAEGLLSLMQEHSVQSSQSTRDDSTPDTDELLLAQLSDLVRRGERLPTCEELLKAAKEASAADFSKGWNGRRVSNVLGRYGIKTKKSGSRRPIEVPETALRRIQANYGFDLGFHYVPNVPNVPQPQHRDQESPANVGH